MNYFILIYFRTYLLAIDSITSNNITISENFKKYFKSKGEILFNSGFNTLLINATKTKVATMPQSTIIIMINIFNALLMIFA